MQAPSIFRKQPLHIHLDFLALKSWLVIKKLQVQIHVLSWLSALKPSPNAHLPYHGILLEHTLQASSGSTETPDKTCIVPQGEVVLYQDVR